MACPRKNVWGSSVPLQPYGFKRYTGLASFPKTFQTAQFSLTRLQYSTQGKTVSYSAALRQGQKGKRMHLALAQNPTSYPYHQGSPERVALHRI